VRADGVGAFGLEGGHGWGGGGGGGGGGAGGWKVGGVRGGWGGGCGKMRQSPDIRNRKWGWVGGWGGVEELWAGAVGAKGSDMRRGWGAGGSRIRGRISGSGGVIEGSSIDKGVRGSAGRR